MCRKVPTSSQTDSNNKRKTAQGDFPHAVKRDLHTFSGDLFFFF